MNSQNMAFPLAFTRLNATFYLMSITQVIINPNQTWPCQENHYSFLFSDFKCCLLSVCWSRLLSHPKLYSSTICSTVPLLHLHSINIYWASDGSLNEEEHNFIVFKRPWPQLNV